MRIRDMIDIKRKASGFKTVSPLTFPSNVKTKKAKISYFLFYNWYIISMGRGGVVGRFTNLIPEFGFIILAIERFTPFKFTPIRIIYLVLLAHALFWMLGYIWMSFNMDKIETQISTERNPIVKEIHLNIKKRKRENI
jgi:hypothetical protein